MKSLINAISLLIFFISCSSTTVISVNDKNVRILADEQYIGKGTATYTDTKTINSVTPIKLKKEGCEDVVYIIQRNEEIDWGACIGGCLVLVPFLWVQKYKPARAFEYECTPTKK